MIGAIAQVMMTIIFVVIVVGLLVVFPAYRFIEQLTGSP